MRRATRTGRPTGPDPAQAHRDWLGLVEVSGPFLSLPVLRATWPSLDAIEPAERAELLRAHAQWRDDPAAGQRAWVEYLTRQLLGWRENLRVDGLDALGMDVAEYDTTVTPSFALVEPGTDTAQANTAANAEANTGVSAEVKPADVRLMGLLCAPGTRPTARIPGSVWAATPVDRLAQLCRHHDIPLGLATDGRWWALVWAPRGGVTTTAVFDTAGWAEAADRDVVRAFRSLLGRTRFFGVPPQEQLVALLKRSEDSQEDITDALGRQVRQAVELLVTAIGRADVRDRAEGKPGLAQVDAHEVYRGAVSVMMRVVFLLFAEERRLLPSDNQLYANAYSASRLCAELEQRAREGSENELENSHAAWHRLLALFRVVYFGIDHPRLTLHAHDGSLFDPDTYPWLPAGIDDRTVLHMLSAVQHVEVGTGKNLERRTLSFRQLDVEQIGYVYEGLLSFEGLRADGVVLGLTGKPGLEEEVPLSELEAIPPDERATTLAQRYKASGIGSTAALGRKLAPLDPVETERARKKLLAVTDSDAALVERLLPFYGLLRPDLRDQPVVILPGALYVTESTLRKNTGTHYTPRTLAEQVVEHALQPLLYHHGPLQTPDQAQWTHRTSSELLELKVADIAMGSAAFLVAAARYLGDALLNAWAREGKAEPILRDDTAPLDAEEDPQLIDARRQIIEHCLYGVDINPMAVEMAKLSLWLVSMDPARPFTFLDDRLLAGDSLLGITSLEQLEYLHMDPAQGREIHTGDIFDWTAGVRSQVHALATERDRITQIEVPPEDPLGALGEKRRLLAAAEQTVEQLRLFADLTVGAALAHAGRGPNGLAAGSLAAARLIDQVSHGGGAANVLDQRCTWLCTDQPHDGFDRFPLHWPLVFPEVFDRGGFDAIIGNPPFLGGQRITGALGTAFREYLVSGIGSGTRGSADLVAYFVLRAHALLNPGGQTGLIATNTLAQGDTREVGLDQIVAAGVTIRRAVKSKPWPSRSAVLEYCAAWTSRAELSELADRYADGLRVTAITASLEPASRVTGNPHRLATNTGLSFIGSYILGMGFTMEPDRAQQLIHNDPRNSEVLFPYLNGQDLNSDPHCQASRWVINFHDWPEEKARTYQDCYAQVRDLVLPERRRNNDKRRRELWWRFTRPAPELYTAISGLDRVVVITRVSKTVMPVMVPTGQVFSDATVVFSPDDTAMLALLSSAPHYWWALTRASSMKADLRYTPSDVFETFPLPPLTEELRELGDVLDGRRREVMLSRKTGLTMTYNLVFDPGVQDADIVGLRHLHREIDGAAVRAYGWEDLTGGLDHGFHPAGRDLRYTIGPRAQREVLDRLLELNHERYAQEVRLGLHDKKTHKLRLVRPSGEALF